MDVVKNTKEDSNEDKIWAVLEILKKRVDQYELEKEDTQSEVELTRNKRIQKLVMEERHLSAQFEKIRKEIKRYERKYEKVLKKKVKIMKSLIKEDQDKLDGIKRQYQELNMNGNVSLFAIDSSKKGKSKKIKNTIKVKTMMPKFRQKTMPLSKKIRIKIKRNEKLGRREMHFVNESNGQSNAFMDLVKVVKPMTTNTRECRITLQRLTEEQMNRYFSQKRLGEQQRKRKRSTRELPKVVNENRVIVKPKWHIKIPKSVLDESQQELQTNDLNIASCSKNAT